MNGKEDKAKFDNDMKIINESLRLAYGPHTKQEKIGMFIVDLIWALYPIVLTLAIIIGIITLIYK